MSGLRAEICVERPGSFVLDLDFAIAPGETLALLGPNGAGKSSVVYALAGLLQLKRGHITLGDRVLDDANTFVAAENRGIGVVFQEYLLFDHLTVRDNVEFSPRVRGVGAGTADQWIEELGLAGLANRKPSELSGGQAQRVALARALAAEPELLILDEPLAALDLATRTSLRRTLAEHLALYAGPRLLITHDPTDAFILADRIAIVEHGALSQVGSPDELRRHPATPYAAALAGLNLFAGTNRSGLLELVDIDIALATSDTQTEGEVLVTIRPNAVALHESQPGGSPRNSWKTRVAFVEPLGDITRVVLDLPVPLSVDVTPGAAAAMSLAPGVEVWASVKATEIQVAAAQGNGR